MKKIIALVLTVALPICMFSACGINKEQERKEIEETVVGFFENYYVFKEEALNYVDEDCEEYEHIKMGFSSLHDLNEEMVETFEKEISRIGVSDTEKYGKEIEKIFSDAIYDVASVKEYRIEKIKINQDKATVEVVVSLPDFYKMNDTLNSIDQNKLMSEIFSEEDRLAMSKITSKEEVIPYVLILYKNMLNIGAEEAKKRVTEKEAKVTLQKKGEKWLIQTVDEHIL